MGVSLGIVMGLLLAFALSGVFATAAAPASASNAPLRVATGSTTQWAFGGNASADYSCTNSGCGSGSAISSISLRYYVGWVVIYTATSVSSTQTEYEVQAAINASLTLSLSGCVNESGSGPCSAISASANLAGKETASGFSNITNTGTVNIINGTGAGGTVAALALMNAQSSEAFNFSGAYSESFTNSSGTQTANVNFDLGGNETSTVNFPTPLGIVPIAPVPGQWWNDSGSYSATGAYTSGYSLTVNADGHSENEGNWAALSITPSGTLTVNGTDLGAYTLWDNYTTPPTSTSGQLIQLSFSNGEFTGTDGWLMTPSGLYGGAFGALSGLDDLASSHPALAAPASGSESAYYQQGVGFVGADVAASPSSLGETAGPSVNLQAGPEPVSVAQSQYSGITSPAAAGSSGFPFTLLILAVVVVVVVIIGVLVMVRRPGRRRGAAETPPGMPTGQYAGWVPPTAPAPPDYQPPTPPAPPGA
jgi:hypothetical protein